MKHCIIRALILMMLAGPCLSARTWTDVRGRTVEAELLRVESGNPVVSLNGKEVTLPTEKLSTADQEFVQEWLKAKEAEAKEQAAQAEEKAAENAKLAAAGIFSVDGTKLEKCGKMTVIERPYSAQALEDLAKRKLEQETGFKIGLVLPPGFDPSKPQRVYVVSTAVNNPAEGARGNVGKVGMYAKTCAAQGWMCVAFDSNTGFPGTTHAIKEGLALLTKEWPVLKNSEYAFGGFSGGVGACFFSCGFLLAHDYRVIGAFFAGKNADYTENERKNWDLTKKDFHGIRVLVSSGKLDKNAPPEGAEGLAESLKSNGYGEIRLRTHEGGHKFHEPHFAEALTWFAEPAAAK